VKAADKSRTGRENQSREPGGGARKTADWRVLFLSEGELTLDDKIRERRRGRRMAGRAVRVLDIPADARRGRGVFDPAPAGHQRARRLDPEEAG